MKGNSAKTPEQYKTIQFLVFSLGVKLYFSSEPITSNKKQDC
jgi:hypothetical protein